MLAQVTDVSRFGLKFAPLRKISSPNSYCIFFSLLESLSLVLLFLKVRFVEKSNGTASLRIKSRHKQELLVLLANALTAALADGIFPFLLASQVLLSSHNFCYCEIYFLF